MSISAAKWTFFSSLCASRVTSFRLLTFTLFLQALERKKAGRRPRTFARCVGVLRATRIVWWMYAQCPFTMFHDNKWAETTSSHIVRMSSMCLSSSVRSDSICGSYCGTAFSVRWTTHGYRRWDCAVRKHTAHQWRRSRHSVCSRFQSFTHAAISNHDCVRGFNDPFWFHNCPSSTLSAVSAVFAEINPWYASIVTFQPSTRSWSLQFWHPSTCSCILQLVLDRFIHFNRLNCKLDFLGFLGSLGFLVHRLCARFGLSDLCTEFLNFRSPQVFSSTCLLDLILLPRSQLASVSRGNCFRTRRI